MEYFLLFLAWIFAIISYYLTRTSEKRMAAENHALQIRITQLELENASLRKKSRNRDVPEI